jgi:DNA mismatch repair ATPase MutS
MPTSGFIAPSKGSDPEYDDAQENVENIERELDKYLLDMKKSLGDSKLKWKHSQAFKYQIEISTA